MQNTTEFDKSVFSEIICQQWDELSRPSSFNLDVGLIEPHSASKKTAQFICEFVGTHVPVMSSTRARVSKFEVCSVRDVVLVKTGPATLVAAEVWLFASFSTAHCALLSFWELKSEDVDSGTSVWGCRNTDTKLHAVEDLVCSLLYKRQHSTAVVLVPTHCRGLLA